MARQSKIHDYMEGLAEDLLKKLKEGDVVLTFKFNHDTNNLEIYQDNYEGSGVTYLEGFANQFKVRKKRKFGDTK